MPAPTAASPSSLWLSITFRRGNMTVDDYLGRPNKPNTNPLPPTPPETVAGFRDAIEKAIALARQRIAPNPKDADAHYQLGAAVGLRASYTATVEGSVAGRVPRRARGLRRGRERCSSLQPQRKDAGLIVGTYRYIVAALSLPLRMVAYIAGFGGGKEKGHQADRGGGGLRRREPDRCALRALLLYNREKRYDDALKQLAALREQLSAQSSGVARDRDRRCCAPAARGGGAVPERRLARFADDQRPRMFGEDALWRYKRGAALAALGRDRGRRRRARRRSLVPRDANGCTGARISSSGKLALKAGTRPRRADELGRRLRWPTATMIR